MPHSALKQFPQKNRELAPGLRKLKLRIMGSLNQRTVEAEFLQILSVLCVALKFYFSFP